MSNYTINRYENMFNSFLNIVKTFDIYYDKNFKSPEFQLDKPYFLLCFLSFHLDKHIK